MPSSRIIRSYRDLDVWRVAMDVRRDVRAILLQLPRQDRFEIGGQIARAALSIPSNIAEGYNRRGRNDYYQFLSFSHGSVGELDTQLIGIGEDHPHLISPVETNIARLVEISKMTTSIMAKLRP